MNLSSDKKKITNVCIFLGKGPKTEKIKDQCVPINSQTFHYGSFSSTWSFVIWWAANSLEDMFPWKKLNQFSWKRKVKPSYSLNHSALAYYLTWNVPISVQGQGLVVKHNFEYQLNLLNSERKRTKQKKNISNKSPRVLKLLWWLEVLEWKHFLSPLHARMTSDHLHPPSLIEVEHGDASPAQEPRHSQLLHSPYPLQPTMQNFITNHRIKLKIQHMRHQKKSRKTQLHQNTRPGNYIESIKT